MWTTSEFSEVFIGWGRVEYMSLQFYFKYPSWESLGLQEDPTSPFWRRSTLGFLWRNDAKAETPVLWPLHVKIWLIGKDSDAGRDWGQEEKGTTEDEIAGWHHGLDGRGSEWTLRDGDGQGGLACCDSWGHKESDMTERLNWTELNPSLTLNHSLGLSLFYFYLLRISISISMEFSWVQFRQVVWFVTTQNSLNVRRYTKK